VKEGRESICCAKTVLLLIIQQGNFVFEPVRTAAFPFLAVTRRPVETANCWRCDSVPSIYSLSHKMLTTDKELVRRKVTITETLLRMLAEENRWELFNESTSVYLIHMLCSSSNSGWRDSGTETE
jgi:hypothetical protein